MMTITLTYTIFSIKYTMIYKIMSNLDLRDLQQCSCTCLAAASRCACAAPPRPAGAGAAGASFAAAPAVPRPSTAALSH